MRGGILGDPWLAEGLHEPRPEHSEPRLPSRAAGQPFADSVVANRDVSTSPATNEHRRQASPATTPRSGRAVALGGIPVGTLLYLALVGFVALIISGSFGAGFFELAVPANRSPDNRSIAVSHNPAHPPQAGAIHPSISLEAGVPPAPAAAVLPELGSDDAAPIPAARADAAPLPASSGTAPAASTVAPASRVAISSASPDDGELNSAAAPAGHPPPAHTQAARSRAGHRPARDARSPPRLQSHLWSPTGSQAERTRASGQLPARATGRTRHFDGTLTPPAAGTGDPFARRASDE